MTHKTHYEGSIHTTSDSQDFPAASLQDFVRYHAGKGTDYATAFARACEPHGDEPSFEAKFDKYWDRYNGG